MRFLLICLLCVVVLSAGLFLVFEQPEWLPDAARWASKDRVLVFLVADRRGVERVRRAVDENRLVFVGDDAIALIEGRIVATRVQAVAAPLKVAGWGNRPIEIFRVERGNPFQRGGDTATGDVDPERLARLRELVKQPTLSYGEQLFVLQAMNDGIAF